ncbi:MAG: class I SAM-dependent methyltransferase [Eubacteriales bacterium]|nr:class I SAM-dependent methyltransferase [Eubacteriales bacterium]
MQLSLRLSAIADMVTEGNRLVDVGCDHGYLPVYLVLNHKIPGAIAMDVRKGPLSRAQEHIAQYGLTGYIETRLSDGLAALAPGEGDTLVIAGMGGPLMERILTEGESVLGGFQELILQPQSDIPHFRRFIREAGWEIVCEDMVLEDGKFYTMMRAVPGNKEEMEPYTKEQEQFGRLLVRQRHPVLGQYLKRELRLREEILKKLESAPGEAAGKRIAEIEEERRLILAALKEYEG